MRPRWKFGTMSVLLAGISVYAVGNKGMVSGTITGSLTGASSLDSVIKGASVVFYSGGVKIDSVVTNSSGIFSDSLSAGTYSPVKISATGYKSDSDLPALDTSIAVVSNSNSNVNATLTSATASLGGTIFSISYGGGPETPVGGAKVYLQRRAINIGAAATVYWAVDSTTTNANGLYDFVNLIAGPFANYRILIKDSAIILNDSSANTTVTAGESVTLNYDEPCCASIYPHSSSLAKIIRYISVGDKLILDLGQPTTNARTISIINMNGTLQLQLFIPAGQSRVSVPIDFAPERGFIFLAK